MEVVTEQGRCPRPDRGAVVTIGAYDGVHAGHRALIAEVRRRATEAAMDSAVITFDRHPATVVRPDSAPHLLTDLDQKLELLASTGLDHAVVVTFDKARAEESAEEFVEEVVVDCLRAKVVVVGADFHFGHGRRGNVDLLARMGAELGFEVVGMELVGDDREAVSSTRVRKALTGGRVDEAARLLGRPYEVRGVVAPGAARGAPLLGYPTANVTVPPEILLPAEGIYAGWFQVPGQEGNAAAVYVGSSPTFVDHGEAPAVEAYLLDFDGDLYGTEARVRFVERLRGDQRFESPGALAEQMDADVERTRAVLAAARSYRS